jgi:hypothetical protein
MLSSEGENQNEADSSEVLDRIRPLDFFSHYVFTESNYFDLSWCKGLRVACCHGSCW